MNGRDGLIAAFLPHWPWMGFRFEAHFERETKRQNRDARHSRRLKGWD
jgi:hypothetical protein